MYYILYGSQTGNAQDVAEQCWTMARHREVDKIQLGCMDDFTIEQLSAQPATAVFICSTTGQGEMPDNMVLFWRQLLRRALPPTLLAGLRIAVLGLGDSAYQQFNFAAKKLYRRLLQLGATAVCELGLADEQHELGMDGVCEPWLTELWTLLVPDAIVTARLLPPKFTIADAQPQPADKPAAVATDLARVPGGTALCVTANTRVTDEKHFQDTRLITLDLCDSGVTYGVGDVLMVQPSNLPDTVQLFVDFFEIDVDSLRKPIVVRPNFDGARLPAVLAAAAADGSVTLDYLIRHCLDLQSVPRRSFFAHLALHADDELEKERLEELCAAGNQDDLYAYASRPRRTVMETLQDFPKTSRKVPLDYWLDLIPTIKPRAFSIASSQMYHANALQLLVAVVHYKTRLSVPRRGLCSTHLAERAVGSHVTCWVRPGTFKFPVQPDAPVILVGPGTGIAPLRNYLWDRFVSLSAVSGLSGDAYEANKQKCLLFFGCRSAKSDFYFESEWPLLPCRLLTAFSRDQPDKVYVQHRLAQQAKSVWSVLSAGGSVFVSGSANQMPKSVVEELQHIIETEGGIADAAGYITLMERSGRLQMETWS